MFFRLYKKVENNKLFVGSKQSELESGFGGDLNFDSYKIEEECGFVSDEYFLNDEPQISGKTNARAQLAEIGFDYEKFEKQEEKVCILLHGWGASGELYSSVSKSILKYGYDLVIVPDLFGFGKSEEPSKPLSMRKYVCFLDRLICLFSCSKICLVGHSFGGKIISFWLYSDSKMFDVVGKIVLIAPSGIKPRFSLIKWIKLRKYNRLKKKCKNGKCTHEKLYKYGSNDYKNLKSEVMRKTFVTVVNTHLPQTKILPYSQVLLIGGEKDVDVKEYMIRALKTRLVGSKVVLLKNAGHFPFIDYPLEFFSVLKTFLLDKN